VGAKELSHQYKNSNGHRSKNVRLKSGGMRLRDASYPFGEKIRKKKSGAKKSEVEKKLNL